MQRKYYPQRGTPGQHQAFPNVVTDRIGRAAALEQEYDVDAAIRRSIERFGA